MVRLGQSLRELVMVKLKLESEGGHLDQLLNKHQWNVESSSNFLRDEAKINS